MSFNNKRHITAQAKNNFNPQSVAVDVGRQMATENTKENIGQEGLEKGITKGLQKINPKLKPSTNMVGLKGMGLGLATSVGTSSLLNLAEEMKGPKAIFVDYMKDYTKLLNALGALYPQHQELQNMINLGRQLGQQTSYIMTSSNVKGPSVTQAIGTGLKSGVEQAKGIADLGGMALGRTPAQAVYNHKMTKIAIVGEANFGQYGRGALEGAAGGLVGGAVGAGVGAATGAGYEIGKDIWHNTRSNQYKAAAYTNQLIEKVTSMAAQLNKVNPQAAALLSKYANDLNNYVKQNIYKGGGTALERGISAITNFFSGQKDQKADQSTIDQANALAQGGQNQQQPEAEEMQQQADPSQDPQITQGVQYLMGIYQQGMQFYNAGDAQNYNAYKAQYTQGLQNLNQYVAQNYPNQDPSMILGQYVQQMQQQQMQQQGNIAQPQ
jgi:hypothetical protein